jgi:hypothetical protein
MFDFGIPKSIQLKRPRGREEATHKYIGCAGFIIIAERRFVNPEVDLFLSFEPMP